MSPDQTSDISAKAADAALKKDLARILQKVREGKQLTRGERAVLLSARSGGANTATEAGNFTELGEILGVTRRTIHNWRSQPDAPEPAANGKHNVLAWREWIKAKGLKGAEDEDPEQAMGMDALKERDMLAKVQTREFDLAVKRKEYVPIEAVKERWTYHIERAVMTLRKKLEDEAPPVIEGMDAQQIRKEMGRIVDEFISLMHSQEEADQ
jgi:hypothetical protein